MNYPTLAKCLDDLEQTGQIKRIDCELDPVLEIAEVQRRALQKQGPALLFTKVKGCAFPMLGNLFGTMERTRFIFRGTLRRLETIFQLKADPLNFWKKPFQTCAAIPALWHALPKEQNNGTVFSKQCLLSALPQLVSWPGDGGAFITLPLVYSEDPLKPNLFRSNLGMYRVQISGNQYRKDYEAGLHYQLYRGIAPHHATALTLKKPLPVSISVGGPPALTLAAIMPLPPGVPELCFAGILGGRRITMARKKDLPPVPAEADFCITGYLTNQTKPEGPFGDHMGYYSLEHEFPVLQVTGVYHRVNAVWPFTSVGRPPQEDSVLGTFIQELTSILVPSVFHGIKEVHAVDAAGVHALLLAIGSERYLPYSPDRKPQEILTQGLQLLSTTQTSLSKFVLIAAEEDAPQLSTRRVDDFFLHMLQRTDFRRDIHILSRMPADTLDYTGLKLHEGSKMLWAASGHIRRKLSEVVPATLDLAPTFKGAQIFRPGIMVMAAPPHRLARGQQDPLMNTLARSLTEQKEILNGLGLVVIVDNVDSTCANWNNFLWTTFTRSDPATDSYGVETVYDNKHWGCTGPLLLDARLKSFHPDPLQQDPNVTKRIDKLAAMNGPLHKIID